MIEELKGQTIKDLVLNGDPEKRVMIVTFGAGWEDYLFELTGVDKNKYRITTLASFCTKWCTAYRHTAEIDTSLSPDDARQCRQYFAQMYTGAQKIFSCSWAKDVLRASYSSIVITDYNSWNKEQKKLFDIWGDTVTVYKA